MSTNTTMIHGVAVKQLRVHSDDRGSLMEVLRADDPFFAAIKQTTYTEAFPGVIKAFHWHKRQKDIWFFATGAAQVVLYDLRPDSPTFLRHLAVELTPDNGRALYIPTGCAHGFYTLADATEVEYLISAPYRPEAARGVRFDDPLLGVRWPGAPAVISARDRDHPPVTVEQFEELRGLG